MPVLEEGKNLNDVLLYEGPNAISRSNIALNETELGTVVNSAGNKVKVDGTETPAGIVVGKDMVVDYHCIVSKKNLVWPATMSQQNIDTTLSKLSTMGIKAR
ncbi:head decoration protein [Alteromonadaceae bacterium M269]|nr:head decoration protein [Alteromonadaceae bacterium M269]